LSNTVRVWNSLPQAVSSSRPDVVPPLYLAEVEKLQDHSVNMLVTIDGPMLQAVSSRPDVVPPLYLAELEKLQDQIPPFPNDDAFAVIQLELGQPPAGIFSELGATTVAAASLGQVGSSKGSWLVT